MEGFLEKERLGTLLPTYDKMYFRIVPEDCVIIYASSPEHMAKGDIEGKILMRSILDITQTVEDDKKFEIVVKGLACCFLAKTAEECTNWVETINKVHTEIKRKDRRLLKELLALHPDAKLEHTLEEEDEDPQIGDEFSLLQPVNVVKSAIQTVIVKGTINPTINFVKAGMKSLISFFTGEGPKTDEEYLMEKFGSAASRIHPQNLKTHFKMGMLLRETREVVGVDSVDKLINDTGIREVIQTRWCLLISPKPVCRNEVNQESEANLTQDILSIPVDFDTLYLYRESCDNSGPVEIIPLKDVVHLNIKKLAQDNEEYLFTLDLGHRRFNLVCSSFINMVTWLEAIQASRATAFEIKRSKDPILKNLFWMMKIQDDEDGDAKFAQRIKEDYEKLSQTKVFGLKSFMLVQQKIAQEFLSLINACLVCQVPRIDMIKMYTSVYHENLLNSFKNFYKERSQDLDIESLIEMIQFLDWYQNSLLVHGTSFADPRIKESLDVLSTAAATYILKKLNSEAIKKVHEQFLNNPLLTDSKDRIISQNPEHISRILRETLNFASFYNTKDFILKLLEACKTTLQNYQDSMAQYIQDKDISNEKLVAICNDVARFKTEIKEFIQTVEKLLASSNSEDISLYLNSQSINESFEALGEKSHQKLAKNLLVSSEEFIDLDFPSIIRTTIQRSEVILSKVHPSLIAQLSLEILKEAAENCTKTAFKAESKVNLEAIAEHLKSFKELEESDIENVIQQITDLCSLNNNKSEEPQQGMEKNQNLLSFVVREDFVGKGGKSSYFSSLRFKLDGILKMESSFVKDVLVGNTPKYFSLRNDKLFCFEHKKAETATMTFNFREAVDCYAEGPNSFILTMLDVNIIQSSPHLRTQKPLKEAILQVVENVKDHQGITEWKFFAEKPDRRDIWVAVINNSLNKIYEDKTDETQINDPSIQIYENTSSLFAGA